MTSAFLLGFLGSFHCLGMCAPIAFALQKQGSNPAVSKILYSIGRITTYVILGAIVGTLGNALAFTGFQKWLSMGSGFLMIAVGLLAVNLDTILLKQPKIQQLYGKLSMQMGRLIQQKHSSFLIGMMNGLLPCGLVYFAIFGAMATGSFTQGLFYMALFGLGTLPLMLGTAFAGQFVQLKWRNSFKKLYPIMFVLMGAWVIFKANNLESSQGKAVDNSVICLPK